jgi:hypothetical protein
VQALQSNGRHRQEIASMKLRILMVTTAAVALGGCANKKTSDVGREQQQTQQSQEAARGQEPEIAAQVAGRVRNVQARVAQLQVDAAQLPGETDADQRRLMQMVFSDLAGVLPLIAGPSPTSEFRQGLRVLDVSRQQLATGSTEMATEPTIGQGLRATDRLLVNLNATVFENNPDLAKRLGALGQSIDELDTAHGATNRLLATHVVRMAVDVLQQMANIMADRAGIEGMKPTTAPTTNPAAVRAQ